MIRCIEAGAEDYLPKPFNPVLLRARISACLERKRWRDRERRYLTRLEAEKERSEALLRNILPGQIVGRLNDGETMIADRFEEVTILFADLVGFTEVAARMPPGQLVDKLNRIFSAFDASRQRARHREDQDHRRRLHGGRRPARAAAGPRRGDGRAWRSACSTRSSSSTRPSRRRSRSGSACTPARSSPASSARHKFIYDVWGDTVNVASRLEAHGVPGRIHVSEATRHALAAATTSSRAA